MTPTQRIGRNIRRIRRAQELSQEVVADRAGMARTAMPKYEWGETEPRAGTLLRIAAALNVEPGDLLEGIRWKPSAGCFVVEETD